LDSNFSVPPAVQFRRLAQILKHPIKLLWIGLDSAGKSSLIKRLRTGDFNTNMPRTMGLSVNKLFYEADSNFEIIAWDLGGQIYFREHLWSEYLQGATAIIYVIDASEENENRLEEAKNELWKYVLSKIDSLNSVPVLILGNKSDLENSLKNQELKKRLELSKAEKVNLEVFNVSALTGANLDKSIEWIFNQLVRKPDKKR
jgi:small GTP-binding protein